VPEHSIIIARDYKSPRELAEYIKKVANDEQLYNSYHEWRKRPQPENEKLKKLVDKERAREDGRTACEVCKYAHLRVPGTAQADKGCHPAWF
jgi:hypothetical protein